MLAQALQAAGRKIAKAHREHQTPQAGKRCASSWPTEPPQTALKLEAPRQFDRVARRFHVDYAFYKTGPDKYLLFFKSGQADAVTACFSEYSKRLLKRSKSSRVSIREQLKRAEDQLAKEKPPEERTSKGGGP